MAASASRAKHNAKWPRMKCRQCHDVGHLFSLISREMDLARRGFLQAELGVGNANSSSIRPRAGRSTGLQLDDDPYRAGLDAAGGRPPRRG